MSAQKIKQWNYRDFNNINHWKTLKSIFFFPAAITTKTSHCSDASPFSNIELTAATPESYQDAVCFEHATSPRMHYWQRCLQHALLGMHCLVAAAEISGLRFLISSCRDYSPVIYKYLKPIFGLQNFYNSKLNQEGNMVIKNHPSCYRSKERNTTENLTMN